MTAPIALSLAHATLLDLPPYDLIRVAALTGYRMVGLRLIPIDRPGEPHHALPAGSSVMRDVKHALDDSGLRVLDVEVAIIRNGVEPRTYAPMFESAAELGAKYVLTNVYETDRGAAIEGLHALCDQAAPFGLTPAVEFVSFAAVATLAEAVELIRAAARPDVRILFDVLHFHSTHGIPAELASVPPEQFAFVHMDDGPHEVPTTIDGLRRIAREARLFPGEGSADFAGILPRLPANIPYAVEVTNPARARELGAEAYARLGWQTTTACLSALRAR
jgi:sugar phosphate isomerase/epimerase